MSRLHPARASRRPTPRFPGWKAFVSVLAVALAACAPRPTSIPLSQLKAHIAAGEVRSVVIGPRTIVAVPTVGARAAGAPARWKSAALADPGLIPLLDSQQVTYEGESSSASPLQALLILLGVGGLAGGLVLIYRRGLVTPAGVGGIDVHDAGDEQRRVRYADVMGIDEVKEELEEVVAFLKDPERFARVGARAPKGVLLVGPPGTGKTLLARATAGEAEVPFYSVSGSAFVEMFVGVGARRVRQLFQKARAHAPSIVFIDEIDAVGKGRTHGPGSNEEREQALNQLLVEMDGFDAGEGIVVMAATNRPEILDAALLRPGRFDRHVTVNIPDREGRRAILGVHARKVRLSPSVDLDSVAAGTPGFAGADLANLVNEAALLAAREAHAEVLPQHFDSAVDRVLAGPERKGIFLTEKERRIVAFHEAGHALVAERRPTADPVHKISIVPRAIGALGFTQQLPEDRSLLQRDELVDRLCVLLAGRASEELVFGQVSTGASNDLERASGLARRMVCEFGMCAAVGPVQYGGGGKGPFVDAPSAGPVGPSEATAGDIDREVRLLVEEQASAARATLVAERPALDALADALLGRETLERGAFLEILGRHADCTS